MYWAAEAVYFTLTCLTSLFSVLYYDSFHCALRLPPDSSRLHVEVDPPLCECAHGKPGLMYGIDKHLSTPVAGVTDEIFEANKTTKLIEL